MSWETTGGNGANGVGAASGALIGYATWTTSALVTRVFVCLYSATSNVDVGLGIVTGTFGSPGGRSTVHDVGSGGDHSAALTADPSVQPAVWLRRQMLSGYGDFAEWFFDAENLRIGGPSGTISALALWNISSPVTATFDTRFRAKA